MEKSKVVFLPGAARTDDLLECLLIVARSHGLTPTGTSLMAGLPAENGRLSPGVFERAATRAQMSSQLVRTSIAKLNPALLPAIVLLEGERACVVLRLSRDGRQARVIYPELPDSRAKISVESLEAESLGTVIYARPAHRYDARTPTVKKGRHGHWFWGVIAESRSLYTDVLLAALLANLFALGMPLFSMNVYDRVLPNQAFDTLWVLASGLLIMLVSDLIFRTMRGRFVDLASSRADVKLSAFIMERVLGMRMEQRPTSAGSFASNLRAFESVRDFIGSATVVAFIDLPFGLVFMAVMGWISLLLLLPLLVGAVIMVLYAFVAQARMHELAQTTYRASGQRNASLIEALVGFETIKALAAEAPIQRKWEQSAALLARVAGQLRLLSSSTSHVSNFVQQFVNAAIVLIGAYLIAEQKLTVGGLIACTMLASRAMGPISQIAGLLVQYHTASTALASLDELMKREVERPDGAEFISRGPLKGAISLRDVSFTYPGQTAPSLRNVSLSIKPGEKVAILGRVGSGKTTLEKLILGLYRPTEGAVMVDGIDARQIDPTELRRQIGYTPQDLILFYGTLRDNITMGAPIASHDNIVKAAEIGGILDFVNSHPQGFDMLVGERGESLSGGQRQGVAIARALVNDPPILLLDEPTSSMDYSSEDDIKRKLIDYASDKTVILVSHRTSMLDLADRIIVMDGGRVMADGPKDQVILALRQGRIGKAA